MKTVLFLCVGNSARSQMAEAYFNRLHAPRARAISAGLKPGPAIHPHTVEVMAEDGIDVSGARPKPIAPGVVEGADLIVTVCGEAEHLCPHVPGKTLHWDIENPHGKTIEVFRRARDDIKRRVAALKV